jgi:hypothetical protein
MNILVQPSLVPFTISQEKDLILNILNKEQRKYKIRDLVSLVFSDFSPQEVTCIEWMIAGRKLNL